MCCISTADRVKQIKTDAKVNMCETDKLIASLIAEKEKLLRELDSAKRGGMSATLTAEGQYCDSSYPSLLIQIGIFSTFLPRFLSSW